MEFKKKYMLVIIEMEIPEGNVSILKINKELLDAFEMFLELVIAKQFSRNLRQMLFEFLKIEDCSGHNYYEDLIFQLDALFDLLEVIEDYYRPV